MEDAKAIEQVVRQNRERMLAAARLEEPDQVPVFLIYQPYYHCPANRNEYGTNLAYFLPEVLFEKMARLWRRHQGQAYIGPEFGVIIEASAFGGRIRWPLDLSEKQIIFPVVGSPEDVQDLEIPDPFRDGLMGPTLEVYRYMKHAHPEAKLLMPLWPRGPFTLASILTGGILPGAYFTERSMERIIGWMREYPDVVHLLMEKCTQTLIAWIKAQRQVAGEDREFLMADDQVAFITKEQFKEFALPYLRRIFSELDHPLNTYHNCHESNHLLELIPQTGAHIFHSGPRESCDFFRAKKLIGGQICLMGNVNSYDLPKKTTAEVEAECREVIENCGAGGGFILSTSTSIMPETPHENIDAILKAAEKYGQYPIRRGAPL